MCIHGYGKLIFWLLALLACGFHHDVVLQDEVGEHSDSLSIDTMEGLALEDEGRYREALELYGRYIKKYPGQYPGYGFKADVLMKLNRFEEAAEVLSVFVDFDRVGRFTNLHCLELATAQMAAGDRLAAMATIDNAIGLSLGEDSIVLAMLFVRKAVLELSDGDAQAAIEYADRSLSITSRMNADHGRASSQFVRAMAYRQQGLNERAVDAMEASMNDGFIFWKELPGAMSTSNASLLLRN